MLVVTLAVVLPVRKDLKLTTPGPPGLALGPNVEGLPPDPSTALPPVVPAVPGSVPLPLAPPKPLPIAEVKRLDMDGFAELSEDTVCAVEGVLEPTLEPNPDAPETDVVLSTLTKPFSLVHGPLLGFLIKTLEDVATLSARVAPLAKGGMVIVLSLALGTVGKVAAGSTTPLSGLGNRDILGAGGGFDTRLTEPS